MDDEPAPLSDERPRAPVDDCRDVAASSANWSGSLGDAFAIGTNV